MPFSDDVKLGALGKAAAGVTFFDVLQRPVRFRFAIVGGEIEALYGQSLAGMFADEITPQSPLDYLVAQCSATIESRGATYFRSSGYSRLILPLWGDGHINGLLGAVASIKGGLRRR